MFTSDFDYDLTPEQIAQTPIEPRHASRLLVLHRDSREIEHATFWELGHFLRPGDLLALNQTRVIPARLFARKVPSGGRVELLLLRRLDDTHWEALVGGKGLHPGKTLQVEGGPSVLVEDDLGGSRRMISFAEPITPFLESIGQMPLPPYIHTPLVNPDRYQTVYARQLGSAAAPTAGLHFTTKLMEHLNRQGILFTYLTLHVGLDTFAPVTEDKPSEHKIHTEWCELSPQAANEINQARQRGGRIIAVGTTSVRVLESAAKQAANDQVVGPFSGSTDLYILPGFSFHVVDAMITNFHLPRSTLLMLVSAFAGRETILRTYRAAMQAGYRFYSFGDAMLIE